MRATMRKEQTSGGKSQYIVVSTGSPQDFAAASWANYLITLTETAGAEYIYIGNVPANVAAGWYYIDIYSGTLISSTNEATLFGYWDTVALRLGASDVRQVAGTVQTPGDLYPAITAIGIVGTQVAATISSVTRTVGDNDGGLASAVTAHDESYFNTGENGGLEVDVVVNTSTTTQIPVELHVTGYYNGSPTHSINVQAYNYNLSAFETIGVMLNRSSAFDYSFPLTVEHHKTSDASGKMEIKFIHSVATYNSSHVLRLDWVQIDKQVTDSETASAIAAIKAKTDQLAFTLGAVDANTVQQADVAYRRATTTGNWASSGTWLDSVVPSAGEHVLIDAIVTIAADLDLSTFASVTVGGNGSLNINTGVTVAVVPRTMVVDSNLGTIGYLAGTVLVNSGTIQLNVGHVKTNQATGVVSDNYAGGVVTANYSTSTVTVNEASGLVVINAGTVTTNQGTVVYGRGGTIGSGNAAMLPDGVADQVWDEATSGHTTNGTFGKLLGTTWGAVFSGITSLANWLRALARKSTADATALSEINTSGGTYSATTDSLEAQGTVLESATFIQLTVSKTTAGDVAEIDLVTRQHEKVVLAITADTAQTGDSHRFSVFDPAAPTTEVFSLTTAGGAITVGGTGNKTVTVTIPSTNTATAKAYTALLWNTTDEDCICKVNWTINANPDPTP
jgi:hypothetical protein